VVMDALIFSLSKRLRLLATRLQVWRTLHQSGDRIYALGFLGEDLGIHAYILGNGLHACARYFYGDLGVC
jgi:hypothetical protein